MFKKLFDIFKDKNRQTAEDIRKEIDVLQRVDEVITSTTYYCYENTLSLMKIEKEDMDFQIELYYEYLYLFRHLILRQAFTQLPFVQMKILHEYVAGTCTPLAVNTFLKRYPEIAGNQRYAAFYYKQFFSKIDEMEVYLSASREIIGDDKALLSKFGNKVVGLAGGSADSSLSGMVIHLITYAYQSMKIDEIIEQAKRDIFAKIAQ